MSDVELVEAIAQAHLPEGIKQRWLELLRPAIHLIPASNDSPVVARLGGVPDLPADAAWPDWSGHGPLAYIGEVLCAPAAEFDIDLPIPDSGRLLFFYFDGSYDNFAATVGTWDVTTLQGARAIHVPDGVPCTPAPTPSGVCTYPERRFTGRSIQTAPGWEHPDLRDVFLSADDDARSFLDHPVTDDAFNEALHERHTYPMHQIGGYADPVQGPVEHEVALAALNNKTAFGDPQVDTEAGRWELLLQVDTDGALDMMWGDGGVLYWMARPDDLATGNLTEISFTWQCS